MENSPIVATVNPGLHDRLEMGVASEEFPFHEVEDAVGVLMEAIPDARLSRAQASLVLAWVQRQAEGERKREEAGMLVQVLDELVNSTHLKLDLYAMALVVGITAGMGYSSQQDVAVLLKLERATVSKAVKRWEAIFESKNVKTKNLTFRRSDEARKHCSEAQNEGHWRNRSAGDFARK